MRVLEFGEKENRKIILLHGLNVPWQMWKQEIKVFSQDYCVLVPVLDGHDAETNNPFISIEDEAEKIKNYYLEHYGNSIYMIIGMSMGAAIAFKILSDRLIKAEYLVLESGVFVKALTIHCAVNKKIQLGMMFRTQKRDEKTLKHIDRVFGKLVAPHYITMADKMTRSNLLTAVNAIGNYHFPSNIQLDKTRIIAFRGNSFMDIQARKSTRYLKRKFPKASIKVFPGYRHGELSVNRPFEFIDEIHKAIEEGRV
jgi:pimeloyl-ACP methyl ester carboxylesterase